MTQQEFTQRVNVEVSNKEFEAINEVYMNSDLDKDEYCKMWVKMNKSRVEVAIENKKKSDKENADRERLWDIRSKLNKDYAKLAADVLGSRDRAFLERKGFKFEESRYGQTYCKTVSSVRYEISCYLGIA